ncbi:hypothetical protein [Streptomyces niveiscabiei]|uniref:Lipoprotein n=1 Tax=Streptomyces niveiscabiei TaxID=164115 RepID=A0ABW9HN67_9ACTN
MATGCATPVPAGTAVVRTVLGGARRVVVLERAFSVGAAGS